MTNSLSYCPFWDHYCYDISQFILELCRQSHLVYLVALILAFTLLRKHIAAAIFSIPLLIRELRDAGLRRVAGIVIEANVEAAKAKRLEDFSEGADLVTGAPNGAQTELDRLTRNAILHFVDAFPENIRRDLRFDVAVNLTGRKIYADAFLPNFPDGKSDSFFEVKSISARGIPKWENEMKRYSELLLSYSKHLHRRAKGFLIVVIRSDYAGDATRAMIDAVFDNPDNIDVKFIFESDLKP